MKRNWQHLAAQILLFLLLASFLALPARGKQYSHLGTNRRALLQQGSCQAQCPSQSEAVSVCSALPSSTQSTIRNTLIANCGNNAITGSTGGCCDSIPSSQWSQYLNCMCAGNAVLSGLAAFVDASAVVAACGCSKQPNESQVTLTRSDLPTSQGGTATPSTPGASQKPTPTSPPGSQGTPPGRPPPSPSPPATGQTEVASSTPPASGNANNVNPIATEILASQGT